VSGGDLVLCGHWTRPFEGLNRGYGGYCKASAVAENE
jgi:hypothetical protein